MQIRDVLSVGLMGLVSWGFLAGSVEAQTSRPSVAGKVKNINAKAERIRGLAWFPSLESAMAANRRNAKDKRPIFFVRMLGDMKGKT